jgi:hypothetical protein
MSDLDYSKLWMPVAVLTSIALSIPAHAQTLELTCGGTSVRLVCEDHDDENKRCDVSHVEFVLPSGKLKTVHAPKLKNLVRIPDLVECRKSPKKYYVVINFSNGAPGRYNEFEDLFSLQGTALTHQELWLDKTIERLGIERHIISYVEFLSNFPLPPQLK